ncbi:MAG TPA: hypothetical protein PK544_01200 [Spirochaetota bacterium]|nr:hypothetical protein [Spirochaetota bacterium]HPJ37768.1 hypothetical protein [Spirochaetota bacterium]HPQ52372.1 hypothetical protein [Spirochaetota bacterium]
MTVKPIDMQVNINQMHEVARNEQVRSTAVAEMQHGLEKESNKKGEDVKSRLEENKKAEKTIIMKEDFGKGQRKRREGKREQEQDEPEREKLQDDRMGRFIDVKK